AGGRMGAQKAPGDQRSEDEQDRRGGEEQDVGEMEGHSLPEKPANFEGQSLRPKGSKSSALAPAIDWGGPVPGGAAISRGVEPPGKRCRSGCARLRLPARPAEQRRRWPPTRDRPWAF